MHMYTGERGVQVIDLCDQQQNGTAVEVDRSTPPRCVSGGGLNESLFFIELQHRLLGTLYQTVFM